MNEQEIASKLDEIISRLERIEQRQIVVKTEIEEQPEAGSFGRSELPH